MMDTITTLADGKPSREIPLAGERGEGKTAKVSAHRYEYLSQFRWYYVATRGYAARIENRDGKRRMIYMHREIMGFPEGMDVDHKNGDMLDNRDENLRAATRSENNMNGKKRRGEYSSRYRGVTWNRIKRRWQAQIDVAGRHLGVGYFVKEEDAARARDGAAIALHGAFAQRTAPDLEPLPYLPPSPIVKTSSYPGVGWSKAKQRWRAFVTIAGKFKHLGYFKSEKEAYDRYQEFLAG